MLAWCCLQGGGLDVELAVNSRSEIIQSNEETVYGQQRSPVAQASAVNPIINAAKPADSPPKALMALPQKDSSEELARVKNMVSAFTERAVEGVFCTYLKERTQERLAGLYCIDSSAKYIIILSGDNLDSQEVACPIADIAEMYSLENDGADCFPNAVVAMLNPEEAHRLFMVVYRRKDDQKKIRFCILEDSREGRDIFMQSVSVLAVYMQTMSGSKVGSSPTQSLSIMP